MPTKPTTYRPMRATGVLAPRAREESALRDRARGTSSARGYGQAWRAYSRARVAQHPECSTAGCTRPGALTDHIVPVTGPADPLFWDQGNHQTLCWSCHSRKTHTTDRGKGRSRRGSRGR